MSARNRGAPFPVEGGAHGVLPPPYVLEPPFARGLSGVSRPAFHERTREAHLFDRGQFPPNPMIIEERSAAQHIQSLLVDNQRLAAAHSALKQELEVMQFQLKNRDKHAQMMQAKKDLEMRELSEKSVKMQNEICAVRAQMMNQDLGRVAMDLQQVPALKTEIKGLKHELERLRAVIVGEKKVSAESFEHVKVIENKVLIMTGEMDRLRANLADAGKGARAAAGVGNPENLYEVKANNKKKRRRKKAKKKVRIKDEVDEQTKTDTGSARNPAEENVNRKRKRIKKEAKSKDEIQSMDEVDGMLNLPLSDGNHGEGIDGKLTEKEWTAQEAEISAGKELSLPDLMHDKENPRKDEEAKVSVGKESSLPDSMHDKESPLNLGKDEEFVTLPDVVEVSSNGVSSEIVQERSDHFSQPMKVDEKFIPRKIQHSPHHNEMVRENAKLENAFNDLNDEIFAGQGECSTEGRGISSTCNVEMASHPTSPSPDVQEAECLLKDLGQYPRIAPIVSSKRKLLVLDVNGLLTDAVMPAAKDCGGDLHISGQAIFRRPFCRDFLEFCFQNFDLGIWSSISKKITDEVVDYLLGDLKNKLLFCWDMSHSTRTGFKPLKNIHKPLVCKEIRKIWGINDPYFPWMNGDFNKSNSLLLCNSPYESLLNPCVSLSIFPNSYHYEDEHDNLLGPQGDLLVYLEGLLASENVQKYVEQHPFSLSVSTRDRIRTNPATNFTCHKTIRQ